VPVYYDYGMYASLAFQYLIFACIFILDRVNVQLTVPRVKVITL
jgi:hypothetical protein